jgi:hypothetical protein
MSTSHHSGESSRFSLWGMPLDAPAPTAGDLSRTLSEELSPLSGGGPAGARGGGGDDGSVYGEIEASRVGFG